MEYTERIINKSNVLPVNFNSECFAVAPGCSRTIRRNNDLVNMRSVLANIANGQLTKLDLEIINIAASMGYVTENTLKTYLRLAGVDFTSDEFIRAEERLLKNQLIYMSNVESGTIKHKIYSADNYGSQVSKNNGIYCKFYPFAISEPASTVIKKSATAQLGAAYLASSNPTVLRIRPLLETDHSAVRPSMVIELEESSVIVEVVRRDELWQSELLEKCDRLNSALKAKGDDAFLMFCGEDKDMNREIYELLHVETHDKPILFTEDSLLGTNDFKHSIYYFNSFGYVVATEFASRVLK